ncbi:unnamed protein product [Cuscuta campestris]|uniref:Uncharacterized protein n=1 Tax=Cuscuta campestris TaxID=132261 RepID=A0A484KHG8_9ASTE|nr:unnamed protein product [Cuscuta campestris]
MVQKLLQTTIVEDPKWPKSSTAPPTKTPTTPLDSCNISPSESCRVSCELSPQDFNFAWSTDLSTLINAHPKKSWSKKLKLVKKSLTSSHKIKAYLKGLFIKSGSDHQPFPRSQDLDGVHVKSSSSPNPTIASVLRNGEKDEIEENVVNSHSRRGAAVALQRLRAQLKLQLPIAESLKNSATQLIIHYHQF